MDTIFWFLLFLYLTGYLIAMVTGLMWKPPT
jgi:hypothetical protein